ncbi:MAG: MBL fold metallo-hydrolase [Chloroflexi bacterium]|nr:MBL fold metallo-hydrolase [Chloroflexota bacterium]
MLRERVSDTIYVFTSELYAQVTAGVIVTDEGVVIVDTLPYPSESRELASFVSRVRPGNSKYIVLTHYHADHVYGAGFFPDARLVSHTLCRELLARYGQESLDRVKEEDPELADVSIRLPDITFSDGEMGLQLGGRVVRLIHAPGHTRDSVMIYVEDDRVLFASDVVMPVPSIADGDTEAFKSSLRALAGLPIENLVQGHGEVILRGEVDEVIAASLNYLEAIEAKTRAVIEGGKGRKALHRITIESCGLSRIPLNGLVQYIHQANVNALYDHLSRA